MIDYTKRQATMGEIKRAAGTLSTIDSEIMDKYLSEASLKTMRDYAKHFAQVIGEIAGRALTQAMLEIGQDEVIAAAWRKEHYELESLRDQLIVGYRRVERYLRQNR